MRSFFHRTFAKQLAIQCEGVNGVENVRQRSVRVEGSEATGLGCLKLPLDSSSLFYKLESVF